MNVIIVDNEHELSEVASDLLTNHLKTDPRLVLGVATGGTPIQTYERFVDKVRTLGLDVSQMKTINLDEYVGLEQSHEESYSYFTQYHLAAPLKLTSAQSLAPDGRSSDLGEECIRYEQAIKDTGGVDLQILGVGRNGHIGFNEPGTPLDSRTHIVDLTESTREANARFFDDPDEVPTQAITVGIATIMESREILLLASGSEKAEAVHALLKGNVNPDWPVTILNEHKSVTLIVTKDALPEDRRGANNVG